MVHSANLPAPYLGQDTLTPTAVLKSPACETLFNFNTTEAGISLRYGDGAWASKLVNTAGGVTQETFRAFVAYGSAKLFMAVGCNNGVGTRYYDISTDGAAPTLAYTSTTGIAGEVFYTYFNGRVFTFSTSGGGDYYDGAAWGASTYSYPGGLVPIGGCVFKHRQYFIFKDGASYGYGEIDGLSGAVTEVPLASIVAEKAELWVIAPITISNEVSSQQLLAFVFSTGEVLFYSGSYPNGGDWALVGSANIGVPLNYNSCISPYRGDSLVACRDGLYSLRDLFLRGSQDALNLTLSRSITPDWTTLVDRIISDAVAIGGVEPVRIPYVGAAWWKAESRLIIAVTRFIKSNDELSFGNTFFILDTLRGGWTVHHTGDDNDQVGDKMDLIVFKGRPLYCAGNLSSGSLPLYIANKEGRADFLDFGLSDYNYKMLSAPIPFPKTAVYSASQIEPILESDLYAQTDYSLVVDFGRQTSGSQKTDAATTSVAKPAANVGIGNITFVQVQLSGTTAASKTVGLKLYSYNVWYDGGKEGSR
jgi:hypothetical protein